MAELRELEFREKTLEFRSKGSSLRSGDLHRLKMSTPNTVRPTSPHRPCNAFAYLSPNRKTVEIVAYVTR